MWFLSMPSLVISCVLTVFYLISLVLHVASRKKEENHVEIATVIQKNDIYQQQTVSLNPHNTFVTLDDYYNSTFQKYISFDFIEKFAILNSQFSILNYSTTSVFYSGTCWKHQPRPPPIG